MQTGFERKEDVEVIEIDFFFATIQPNSSFALASTKDHKSRIFECVHKCLTSSVVFRALDIISLFL